MENQKIYIDPDTLRDSLDQRPLIPARHRGAMLHLQQVSPDAPELTHLLTRYGLTRSLSDPELTTLYWGHPQTREPYPLDSGDYHRFLERWDVDPKVAGAYLDERISKSLRYQTTAPSSRTPMGWTVYEVLMPLLYLHGYDFHKAAPQPAPEPVTEPPTLSAKITHHPYPLDPWGHPELEALYGIGRTLEDAAYEAIYTKPYPLTPQDVKAMYDPNGKWQLRRNIMLRNIRLDPTYRNRIMSGLCPPTLTFYKAVMPVLYLLGYDFPS